MAKASNPAAAGASSIVAAEAEHFGAMATDWWNPKGTSAMLHRLNPVRLRFLREAADAHWHGDPASYTPLVGKRALDIGCGAGLLAEPLARLGAAVTGVDAAPENIGAAKAHAEATGIAIDYRSGDLGAVAGERFDLVAAMEVIEHVADPAAFVAGLAETLADDGLLILSTPNRTALSRVAMIGIAEGFGMIPRGTHDWHRFLTPADLAAHFDAAGLAITATRGIALGPRTGFVLSDDLSLNYIVSAVPKG